MESLKEILSDIEERFVSDTKSTEGNDYREIFQNPSRSEFRDIVDFSGRRMGDSIRFIAVKESMNVYCTSADVFHRTMVREIDEIDRMEGVYGNFSGMAELEGGEVEVSHWSDVFEMEGYFPFLYELCEDLINGDYDWMERYNFDLSLIKDVAREEKEFLEDEYDY